MKPIPILDIRDLSDRGPTIASVFLQPFRTVVTVYKPNCCLGEYATEGPYINILFD